MFYPDIEPYNHFQLQVSSSHILYIEECGNPEGIPVLFVHGGPGAGCKQDDRCFFDPDQYRIIIFDQRGCGRSKPLGSIKSNTTEDLVHDIEYIRQYLAIENWVVFGGSWGSTLSLVYAIKHTNRIQGLILRGVFFASAEENRWLWQDGFNKFYPEAYQRYKKIIPENQRDNLITGYYEMMTEGNEQEKNQAAIELMRWDSAGVTSVVSGGEIDDSKLSFHQGLIEAHFCANLCFLEEGFIRLNLKRLEHLPTFIVNGRYDMLTPPKVAYELHMALPLSQLNIVEGAGHSSKEPNMIKALVSATDRMAKHLRNQ
jgi:proline iminopeptidase